MAKYCKIRYKKSGVNRKGNLYLASYSNGQMKAEESDNTQFQVYANRQSESSVKNRRILVTNTPRMSYSGFRYDSEGARTCNYFICVANKKKNKLRVYDTDLYNLKPVLEVHDGFEDQAERSYREKIDDLTSTFGSKAKRRSMKSRAKFQMNEEAAAESALSAVDKSVTDRDLETSVNTSTDESADVLPPINREADELEDVFNLHDIIPQEEYEEMEALALELVHFDESSSENWKKDGKYSELLLNYLRKHKNDLNIEKAKLLVYLNYYLWVYRLNYRDMQKRDPCPEIPEPYKSNIFKRFVVQSYSPSGKCTKSIPLKMKDKILSHALVLCLFIFDFSVDLTPFQADFKFGTPKLIKIVHALACHIAYSKGDSVQSHRIAELKFPLFVAKENAYRGRGKK